MPNAQVFAAVEGFAECLIISVSAAGAFSLAKGRRPVVGMSAIDIVPITCDVAFGSIPEYIITRTHANSHSAAQRKRRVAENHLVPIVGRAANAAREININAVTGAITAGAASTTVGTLFP